MTSIEWTDATWNPVTGCTKVSAGCKNCYADGVAKRFWGARKFTDVQCHEDRLTAPLHWRKPRRVFVNSMSDLFHEDVPDSFLDCVFAVMAMCPQHTFQVLTKRPERMRQYVRNELPMGWLRTDSWNRAAQKIDPARLFDLGHEIFNNPLPNVWLGVSCEDQEAFNERVPILLRTPAAVLFLSCEPLLGPIDIPNGWLGWFDGPGIDWVIVGGESGPEARPCDVGWIRSIVQQCRAERTPCFVKQLGSKPVARDRWDMTEEQFSDLDAAGWTEHDGALPRCVCVRQFPEARP